MPPGGRTLQALAGRGLARLPRTVLGVALLDLLFTLAMVHRGPARHPWWAWLLAQALVLPLLGRRRHPTGVFAVLAAAAFVQWLAGIRLGADAALLVALFTVASQCSRRRALLAAGVLEVGVVLAAVRFAPAGGGVFGSIVFLSGLVAAALLSGMNLRTRRAYLASVVDRAQRLERERDQQARLAVTAERTRIARELHDIVAHSLSVMVTLADGAAAAQPADPEQARGAMRQVSVTGRQALAEMRRLLGVLREDEPGSGTGRLAPQPGLGGLDGLLHQVREAGVPARLTVTGTPAELPGTQQAVVYRVVQEALTNVLKHGREVSTVQVRLAWQPGAVALDVLDDGAACLPAADGHGLTGMRERVALFGGTVSAGPRPAGGWRVHARLPVDAPAVQLPAPAPGPAR